jgi:hypothetical protein
MNTVVFHDIRPDSDIGIFDVRTNEELFRDRHAGGDCYYRYWFEVETEVRVVVTHLEYQWTEMRLVLHPGAATDFGVPVIQIDDPLYSP